MKVIALLYIPCERFSAEFIQTHLHRMMKISKYFRK